VSMPGWGGADCWFDIGHPAGHPAARGVEARCRGGDTADVGEDHLPGTVVVPCLGDSRHRGVMVKSSTSHRYVAVLAVGLGNSAGRGLEPLPKLRREVEGAVTCPRRLSSG